MKSISEIPVFTGSFADAFYPDPIGCMRKAYETLGPIFSIQHDGKQMLAMGGVAANRKVWRTRDLWDYHTSNRHFREQFTDRYLNQLEGKEYIEKRKRVQAGFKTKMLMTHTGNMGDVVIREMQKTQGEWIDLRSFCMRIIIAMTSRALMQVDLPEGMDNTMAISNKMMLRADTLGPWRHLYYLRPDRIFRRQKIFNYLGSIIDARKGIPLDEQGDDILSLSLRAHPKDAPPIGRLELIHDLSQLMMAGSTTTSHLVLWHFVMLATHPEWQSELREELENWSTHGFDDMGKFPKLKASCLEIERIRPSSTFFNRVSKKAFDFEDYSVPEGTWVMHLHVLAHYLEEIYPKPLEFTPRRFLENPDIPHRDVHGLYGGGSHVCVGSPFARILTPTVIGNALSYFDIEWKDAPEPRARIETVLAPARPAVVRFIKK
ncbi:MAG: cytochrome P450 [Opitutales bacterium]